MNPAVRKYLSRKSTHLKVPGQVAVFNKDTVTVTGLDFLYRLVVPNTNIDPPVMVPIDDFTFAASLLGRFEAVRSLPQKVVLQSRGISVSVAKDDHAIPSLTSQFENGEFVDLPASFVSAYRVVSSYFEPETVYFANPTTVLFGSENWRYAALVSFEDENLPTAICGLWGVIADDFLLVKDASVTWEKISDSWHLAAHQVLGDGEEFTVLFSSLAPAKIEAVGPIMNLLEALESNEWLLITPEVKRALKADFDRLVVTGSKVVVQGGSFEVEIEGVASVKDTFELLGASKEFLLKIKPEHKVYLAQDDYKVFFCVLDENVKVVTTA